MRKYLSAFCGQFSPTTLTLGVLILPVGAMLACMKPIFEVKAYTMFWPEFWTKRNRIVFGLECLTVWLLILPEVPQNFDTRAQAALMALSVATFALTIIIVIINKFATRQAPNT